MRARAWSPQPSPLPMGEGELGSVGEDRSADRSRQAPSNPGKPGKRISLSLGERAGVRGCLLLFFLCLLLSGCHQAREAVVVYTSQDQVYAEPILKRFTARTGIP